MNFRGNAPDMGRAAGSFAAVFTNADQNLVRTAFKQMKAGQSTEFIVRARRKLESRLQFMANDLNVDLSQIVHSFRTNRIDRLHEAIDRKWHNNAILFDRINQDLIARKEPPTVWVKQMRRIRELAGLPRNEFAGQLAKAWSTASLLGVQDTSSSATDGSSLSEAV